MADRLKGRNAVVTGAGSGIGKAVAVALAAEGANIVVCDLGGGVDGKGASTSLADATVEECRKLGVQAIPQYGSVAAFKVAEAMIQACVSNFGRDRTCLSIPQARVRKDILLSHPYGCLVGARPL